MKKTNKHISRYYYTYYFIPGHFICMTVLFAFISFQNLNRAENLIFESATFLDVKCHTLPNLVFNGVLNCIEFPKTWSFIIQKYLLFMNYVFLYSRWLSSIMPRSVNDHTQFSLFLSISSCTIFSMPWFKNIQFSFFLCSSLFSFTLI